MRRIRSSASIKMAAATNPTPAALQPLNPKGCQAQESAARAATNATRTVQEVFAPALAKSNFSLFSTDDASALRAEECASSLFVRLIRPHRISQITAKSNSQPPRGLALHLSGAMRITNAVCIYPGLAYVKKCELDEPVEKYQNQGTGFSDYVEAWYTCADCAEQIRSNGPDSACDAVGKHYIVSVGSVNCGDVADGSFRDIRDVDHRYVHGNDADNRRERSAYEDFAFVSERTMNAVAISGGENGNF